MNTRAKLGLLITLAALLVGCGKGTPMLISQEQEVSIGREVSREVEQQYGRPVTSGSQYDRLQRIWAPLRRQARRTVPYSANLLDNDEVVNAFACPGGPLYFTTALARTMDRDDELAFVVGHELSHVECEHGRQAINQAVLVNAAASLLLKDAGQLAEFGAGVAFTLYNQGYSRQNEREADSHGLRVMVAAGFRPQGAVDALKKLGGGEHHGVDKYLASHPSTPERIRLLQEQIDRDYPSRR